MTDQLKLASPPKKYADMIEKRISDIKARTAAAEAKKAAAENKTDEIMKKEEEEKKLTI